MIGNKKIYYFANARMPNEKAHGIQIAKMCEAFIENGISLSIVAPKRGKGGSIKDFYGLKYELPIKRLPVLPFYKSGRAGFLIGTLSFMFSASVFFLVAKLRREKFIIYGIDMDQLSIIILPILSLFLRIDFFLEIHDHKPNWPTFRLIFKNAKGVIVVGQGIKRSLMERFSLFSEKILVKPNGVDLEKFKSMPRDIAREKLDITKEKKIALYLGRAYDWKGLDTLAFVAEKLKSQVSIFMVGAEKRELLQAINATDTSINCVGGKSHSEIPLWLSSSDCLILLGTKKNEYSYLHTSPMKLFEYMTMGKPIVAPNTPAVREIVNEDEVFFYEPDDIDSLELAINKAINSSTWHVELLAKKRDSLKIKSQNFSWKGRAKDVVNFISNFSRFFACIR